VIAIYRADLVPRILRGMRFLGRPSLLAAGLVAALAFSVVPKAFAAPKDKDEKGAADKTEKTEKKTSGKTAVSAYDQAIIDAHKAFQAGVAGNVLDDAIAAYRKAIGIDPTRPEGHLYLGAALYAKGDYAGAETALGDAENRARAGKEYTNYLGKALFLKATAKEAQAKSEEAKTAWTAYADFAKANPDQDYPKGSGDAPPVLVKVYAGSAMDRGVKIDNYVKMKTDYAKVRELIEKRQKELGVGTPEPKKP
jgi:tetratricopeptide (TPR) repeat protein